MKNSLKRTTLLVTLALMSSALARPVISMTAIPPSTASCHATGEKGSTDRKSFSEPESSITLDWSNRGTDTGLPRPTGISLIFNTPEITAKKNYGHCQPKGNQWNDKGIIYDQKDVSHGKITAAGIIFVETYDDCIYMNSPAHTVDITGFKSSFSNRQERRLKAVPVTPS